MNHPVLRLRRATLAAAVAPEPLGVVLRGLVVSGTIAGFREAGPEVLVWGDLRALEVALDSHEHQELPAEERPALDAKTAYYQRCREFTHARSFRALAPLHREIWRLHATGMSFQAIAFKLGASLMQVRTAVQGARLAARLPRTTTAMPRGGGSGRPASVTTCAEPVGPDLCGRPHHGRGLCFQHWQQKFRRRSGGG